MNNLRVAVRNLAKSPGFAVVATLLLALAIGANTAFFSLFKAHALAPFPYPQPERVVQLWRTQGSELESNPWSVPDFEDVRARATTLQDVGAYRPVRFTLGGEAPVALQGVAATPAVFRALGMAPCLGHLFEQTGNPDGQERTALLSHAFWTHEFQADPAVIGRTIRLDGETYTVVGVMPADFEFHCPWTGSRPIQLWVPLRPGPGDKFRGSHFLLAVGRLKPGVTLEECRAELRVLSEQLALAYPDTNFKKRFFPRELRAEFVGMAALRYGLVAAPLVLLLTVACANVALLFLARGATRQSEYAMRLALGCTPGHLLRLACAEIAVVAAVGCGAGLWLAWHATVYLPQLFPAFSTHAAGIRLDRATCGWSVLLAAGTALAAGLPPALTAARTQLLGTLQQGAATQAGPSRTRHRFLRRLLALQIALGLLLVNTAFLLLLSYRSALAGAQPLASERVLTAEITVKGDGRSGQNRAATWERLLERVRQLPGTAAAAVTTQLPLKGGRSATVLADTQGYDAKGPHTEAEMSWVSPDYFRAMGIRVLRGRGAEPHDAQDPQGIVVNRSLADRFWPGQDPIGRAVHSDSPDRFLLGRVVGVVDDVRQMDIGMAARPELFFPFARNPAAESYLVVRTALDARSAFPAIRRALAEVDPDLALAEPGTMAEIVSEAARARGTILQLVNFFMLSAIAMMGIGLYGTLAFQTRQRTREIGVRLALGGSTRSIVALVVGQAGSSLLKGACVGLLASVAVGLTLRAFLADVAVMNPVYYFAGPVVLAITLACACWLPARRATRINPVEALRSE